MNFCKTSNVRKFGSVITSGALFGEQRMPLFSRQICFVFVFFFCLFCFVSCSFLFFVLMAKAISLQYNTKVISRIQAKYATIFYCLLRVTSIMLLLMVLCVYSVMLFFKLGFSLVQLFCIIKSRKKYSRRKRSLKLKINKSHTKYVDYNDKLKSYKSQQR